MSEDAARPEGPALAPCPHCGVDHPPHLLKCPSTDMTLPLEGRELHGKFRLVRQLGKGGMAAVWSAVNTLVDRRVAIKLIRPDAARNEETVARFRAEAKAAGRIGHHNVCEILDFGLGPLGPYIIMERLRGKSLGQLIRAEGRLDPALTVTIIRQALAGLEAAHKRGIIHRDLKPENVFLHQPEGGPPVVKLMDFGVSKLTDGSSEVVTGHGALLGTPEYMSPEQFKGAAHSDVRTDIWAIGAILYKALTGKTAFEGPSVAGTLLMVTTEEPAPIPELVRGVPPELVTIVERCLAKDPDLRYESAQALYDELEPFDLDTLDGLVLVDPDDDIEAPAPPTIDVTPAKAASPPPKLSRSSAETLLPTTQHQSTEERRPSRVDRRAWMLIGGVTVVGAGLLYWLALGPERAHPPGSDPIAAAASTTAEPRPDLGTPAEVTATAAASTAAEPGSAGDTTQGSSDTTGGSGDATTGTTAAEASVESTGDDDAALVIDDGASTGSTGAALVALGDDDGDDGDDDDDDDASQHGGHSDGPRPVIDPSEPLPVPAGTAREDRYLTPKKPGPTGTHTQAKAYCRSLSRDSFAGISDWKMASPIVARKLSRVVRRGKYWTAALWQGKAIVITLPAKKQSSRAADKEGPRALCVAKWP